MACIVRAPFSQERMTYILEQEAPNGVAKVVCEGKTSMVGEAFTALDWLARLVTHIPGKGEQMVRYYGYYSNKSRGLRKKENNDDNAKSGLVTVESDISRKKFRKNWAGHSASLHCSPMHPGRSLSGKYIMPTRFYVQNAAAKCELFRSLRMKLQ